MGEVYQATDTKLNREVALKILPEQFAKNSDRMARFKREAQVLASLNHPNIASIYGFEEEGDTRALVLELVEGPTLAEKIQQGAIPLDEALNIAKQISEALEAAHEIGIIHRDRKPANVKVKEDGQVKVLDFGLAKALEGEETPEDIANSPTLSIAATQAGIILGTAAYMSPEQARGQKADRRADIWSFGVVLFEMLTGRRLFTGDTISDVLAAVLRAEADWNLLPEDTPAPIQKLLRRCLTRERKQRLQAIGEARIGIEEYLNDPVDTSILMSAPAITAERQPAWKRALPWAFGGVMTVIALVALWGWLSPAPSEQKVLARFRLDFPSVEAFDSGCCGRELAISPGGDRLAFTASAEGTIQLYLRAMDQLEPPVAVAGTENVTTPFFSPDGRWVAFFADGKLKKISIEGGAPLTLCSVGLNPRGGTWGPDDTIVFASAGSSGLFRVPASGGTPKPLTELDATRGETAHRWPEILPGGKTVLFTVMHGGQFDLEAVSLESGKRRLLLENASQPAYAASGHLVYAQMPSLGSNEARGTLLAVSFDPVRAQVTGPPVPILGNVIVWPGGGSNFVLSRNGTLAYLEGISGSGPVGTLVWVDRQGKEETLPEPPRTFFVPRISPDGSKLALNVDENGNYDVWVYDLKRSTLSRLTFDPLADELTPVWSPDGRRIAFSVGAQRKIMLIPADGSAPAEAIASTEFNTQVSSWSPDGKTLFVTEETAFTFDAIKTLDLEGEGKLEVFLDTKVFDRDPVISPGGRWVAYASTESGRYEVYVRPFPGPGGKWMVSSEGGTAPLWSRDGRELFYRNGSRMMAVEVETADTFRASRPRVLFEGNYEYSRRDIGRNYDISPDGKRFLMIKALNQQQTAAPTIDFTFHWFEELRRRVPVN